MVRYSGQGLNSRLKVCYLRHSLNIELIVCYSGKAKLCLQWGSEYQTFEDRKHMNTEHFEGRISNGFGQNGSHFV